MASSRPNLQEGLVTIDTDEPIWERFFTVYPLTLVGTREADGSFDLAPKHMAMPMGWQNYFGFVCTPRHATYGNVQREGVFTVTYPQPTQIVLTSLAAAPRAADCSKPALSALPTFAAERVEGVFMRDGYLFLECELEKIVDGFGVNSLITGRVVAAHVREEALRASAEVLDDNELLQHSPLLAYLYPGRFTAIKETFSFPFPVDFKR